MIKRKLEDTTETTPKKPRIIGKKTEKAWTRGANAYSTPQLFFDSLNARFGFTVDVAASANNAKCARFYDVEQDGLKQCWDNEVVWCNPPYKNVAQWIKKGASTHNATIVYLVPAGVQTNYFHDYIWDQELQQTRPGVAIELYKGRLVFGDFKGKFWRDTMVVIMCT